MPSVIDNKYVVFKLDKEYYAIPINKVVSIEKMEKSTRVPNTPSYVKGVINLRGEVIPLIDLRKKLGVGSKDIDSSTRIIIISEEDMVAGLIVDTSPEVLEIDKENIDNPPTSMDNDSLPYIYGIGKIDDMIIIILELMRILE